MNASNLEGPPSLFPEPHTAPQDVSSDLRPIAGPSALAPDGLPWPQGYFDRKPRITLEEAIAKNGVRPTYYWKGFPVYDDEDCRSSNFKFPYPPEPDCDKSAK